jgi:adenine-specific DNA-methyltransferase
VVRYPRDPSLDPQLVWKGKDEQVSHDLDKAAVPIYIQETIDPLALIEELRAESEAGDGWRSWRSSGLLGPELRGAGRLYRHAGSWTNRIFMGHSLLVMTIATP